MCCATHAASAAGGWSALTVSGGLDGGLLTVGVARTSDPVSTGDGRRALDETDVRALRAGLDWLWLTSTWAALGATGSSPGDRTARAVRGECGSPSICQWQVDQASIREVEGYRGSGSPA